MARINIGSVTMSKDKERPNYIKVNVQNPITLKKGDYLTVESVQFQLENLPRLVEKGFLSADAAEESRQRILASQEKRKELGGGKDFILAEVFVNIK